MPRLSQSERDKQIDNLRHKLITFKDDYRRRGVPAEEVSRKFGWSNETMNRKIRVPDSISLYELFLIANVLNIKVANLFEE